MKNDETCGNHEKGLYLCGRGRDEGKGNERSQVYVMMGYHDTRDHILKNDGEGKRRRRKRKMMKRRRKRTTKTKQRRRMMTKRSRQWRHGQSKVNGEESD